MDEKIIDAFQDFQNECNKNRCPFCRFGIASKESSTWYECIFNGQPYEWDLDKARELAKGRN